MPLLHQNSQQSNQSANQLEQTEAVKSVDSSLRAFNWIVVIASAGRIMLSEGDGPLLIMISANRKAFKMKQQQLWLRNRQFQCQMLMDLISRAMSVFSLSTEKSCAKGKRFKMLTEDFAVDFLLREETSENCERACSFLRASYQTSTCEIVFFKTIISWGFSFIKTAFSVYFERLSSYAWEHIQQPSRQNGTMNEKQKKLSEKLQGGILTIDCLDVRINAIEI